MYVYRKPTSKIGHFTVTQSLIVACVCIILLGFSAAQAANSGVSYQGRIIRPDGSPLEDSLVQFRIQIRSPDSSNCLFYEEAQSFNMNESNGNFALTINDGSGSRLDSTGFGIDRIFANYGTFTFNSALCTSGTTYSPNEGDGRNLVVLFKDSTMSTWEPIPAQKINFVPFAFDTKRLQGFAAANVLRFAESDGTLVNTSPLNNTQYTELLALVNGTSNQFAKAGELAGVSLPALGAGQAGQVLSWTGTGWQTVTSTSGPDSVASSNIIDGEITGADLASNITIATTNSISTTTTVAGSSVTASSSMVTPQIYGSTLANGSIRIDGTSNATKGNVILASSGGNVGVGTTAPISPLAAGRVAVSIKGLTSAGVLELATGQADANDVVVGTQQYSDMNSTSTDKRVGYIVGRLEGATANNRGGSIAFGTKPNNGSAPAERMRIDSAGYVGIATTNPTYPLDVVGGARVGLGATSVDQAAVLTLNAERSWIFEQGGSGATASINFRPSIDMKSFKMLSADRTQNPLTVYATNSGPTNAVYLVPTGGTVGIGTTAPGAYKVDVSGSLNASSLYVGGVAVTAGGGDFLKDGSVTMTGTLKHANGTNLLPSLTFGSETNTGIYRAAASQIAFASGGNQVFRIFGGAASDAYLTSGKARFHTGTAASPTFGFENDLTTGMYGGTSGMLGFSVGGTSRIVIDSSGVMSPGADNTYTLGTSSNRFTNIYATGSLISTSDARMKTNIKDSDLGLEFINTLRPVSFNWKSGDTIAHYGLIAQETEQAVLDAKQKSGGGRTVAGVIVDHDKKTDRYGVKYTELIAPLIKAVQELSARLFSTDDEVARLKAENSSQAKELEELRSRLDRVERLLESKN